MHHLTGQVSGTDSLLYRDRPAIGIRQNFGLLTRPMRADKMGAPSTGRIGFKAVQLKGGQLLSRAWRTRGTPPSQRLRAAGPTCERKPPYPGIMVAYMLALSTPSLIHRNATRLSLHAFCGGSLHLGLEPLNLSSFPTHPLCVPRPRPVVHEFLIRPLVSGA